MRYAQRTLLLGSLLGSFCLVPGQGASSAEQKPSAVIQPWRQVTLDPEYSGAWIVAGDLDGNGAVEIVSARNVEDCAENGLGLGCCSA